jgi:hypothetical protein
LILAEKLKDSGDEALMRYECLSGISAPVLRGRDGQHDHVLVNLSSILKQLVDKL